MEERSYHQDLMDEAYKLWTDEEFKRWDYEQFLKAVINNFGDFHFYAVITGKFNYQVENGGFSQWYDNGYSCTIENLQDFLEKIKKEPLKEQTFKTIDKVIDLLDEATEVINWIEDGKQLVEKFGYEYQHFFREKLEEQGYEDLSRLDSRYYEISAKFMEILEIYFSWHVQFDNGKIGGENISSPTAIGK